ncbi:MAG: M28 family peptidase [Gemmatimonadota bacterium]|nr:MAG: M28 family peptidase [Gemmatimonadota bacterium]
MEAISAASIDAHLRYLSSDLLEGRAPGTRGSELAATYIATQFELAGLEPVSGSEYLRPVRLLARRSRARISFRARGGAALAPVAGEDCVVWTSAPVDTLRLTAEVVYVGYGIHAPEYDWDDFKGVDVSGKVLLLLGGGPAAYGSYPAELQGDYALEHHKFEEAARRGAAGAVLIHLAQPSGYQWGAVRGARGAEILSLGATETPPPALHGWLSEETARQVIGMASLDFTTLVELANSRQFRPIGTGVNLRATIVNRSREFADYNVAGLLRGGDPGRAGEVVLFAAHFDHLGIGPKVGLDSIYNGAYDNASGIALLITLAGAFARMERPPARSLLFLALTAAEPDLLGSAHYVSQPLVPLAQTVTAINLDRANLWGPTADLLLIGDEARLYKYVEEAAAAERLQLRSARGVGRGHRYRSDELSFLGAGVPAVRLGHGLDFIGRMPGWGEAVIGAYGAGHYRQPSDEYRPDFDYRGAVQQGRVAFRLGLQLANSGRRPR